MQKMEDNLFIRFMCKSVCVAMGVGAIWWSLAAFKGNWHASQLDTISTRIFESEPFPLATLRAASSIYDHTDDDSNGIRPETLRAAAVASLRLLEQELLTGRRNDIDSQFKMTEDRVVQSLSMAPSDAFCWLALYWIKVARRGFRDSDLRYLRMSYLVGPNEGWIAARRNRFALIVYSRLPVDLAAQAVLEFSSLVALDYSDAAADIFVGPGWPLRDTLLATLDDVPIGPKQRFAKRVYDLGFDVVVPGVTPFGVRPWH